MKFIISGRNLEVSEGLKNSVIDKLGRLERYFTPDTEVNVTMSIEKERQKIEVRGISSVLNRSAMICMFPLIW